MKKSGSAALAFRQRRQRLPHVRARAVGKHHAVGDLAGQRDHALAQGRQNDRRQRANALVGAEFLDETADVGQRLARRHAHAHVRRRMAHADAEPEAAAGDLVQEGRALCEVADRARVDRRNRGAEDDALRHVRQRLAQRHVAEEAGRKDARKPAPLDLARDLERGAAPAWHGDQADRRTLLWHRSFLPATAFLQEQ